MGDSSVFFHRLAVASSLLSAACVLFIAVGVPLIYFRSNVDYEHVYAKSQKFRADTNRMWSSLQGAQFHKSVSNMPIGIQFFSRKQRSSWGQQICSGCNQLNCPAGGPGLPGPPGDDGLPGTSGLPGKSGEDGFDVELEPENDLPCIICPAGPPGQRGMQGERGQPGNPGLSGESGPPGNPGINGPVGGNGPAGNRGPRGPLGPVGEPGGTTIAGVGIRGPKGPPGPAGPKGPTGPPGKSSKEQGMPGRPGPSGNPGSIGNPGRPGDEGPWGPPGEPGQPAAYCPSDCGVSQILAPSIHRISEETHQTGAKPENAYSAEVVPAAHHDEDSGNAKSAGANGGYQSGGGYSGGYYSRYST